MQTFQFSRSEHGAAFVPCCFIEFEAKCSAICAKRRRVALQGWDDFFLGELGAAAALTGLLFVAVSVNQARILELGRMADRGIEALVMLFLVIAVASLPLVPHQPVRLLGLEILLIAIVVIVVQLPLQRTYLTKLEPAYRGTTMRMVWINRIAVTLIALAGAALVGRGDGAGLYILPAGFLLTFFAAGANAWVLLVEINR